MLPIIMSRTMSVETMFQSVKTCDVSNYLGNIRQHRFRSHRHKEVMEALGINHIKQKLNWTQEEWCSS